MELCPPVQDVQRNMDVSCQIDLEITNTSSFPLFGTDWGTKLGKPSVLGVPAIYILDGQAAILPRLEDGGLEFITY
jgi:hypothetical protein